MMNNMVESINDIMTDVWQFGVVYCGKKRSQDTAGEPTSVDLKRFNLILLTSLTPLV